ncbi:MAG: HAD family phosphatase [Bacteroidetes bacterium]|nr:MAG: HAD family phosphatase [Bacteroidota bacterium]
MKNYSAYLFDMDGTLVNSEGLKGKALVETCSLYGSQVDVAIYKVVMGETWSKVTNHFFNTAGIKPNIDEFTIKFRKIYQELLREKLSPNPNAKELLSKFKERCKKIGLVSSASAWMVNQVLVQLKISDFFDVVVTYEDITNHKPSPEAYLVALEKLAISNSEVLIFEDSNAGLIAAQKAMCDVVAFRHEFNTNNDFSSAIKIISDFNEFPV